MCALTTDESAFPFFGFGALKLIRLNKRVSRTVVSWCGHFGEKLHDWVGGVGRCAVPALIGYCDCDYMTRPTFATKTYTVTKRPK